MRAPSANQYLLLAFIVTLLAIGIPYWMVPYQQVGLPNTLYTPALLVPIICAFFLRFFRIVRLRKVTAVMTGAMVATVVLRVIIETTQDPTSHNLWPFELILVAGLGLVCVLPAALLGGFFSRHRTESDSR